MEPLSSPMVAIGGNRWQIGTPRKVREQAKTVAVGRDRLWKAAHGKEGVDGSSPSEGLFQPRSRCKERFLVAAKDTAERLNRQRSSAASCSSPCGRRLARMGWSILAHQQPQCRCPLLPEVRHGGSSNLSAPRVCVATGGRRAHNRRSQVQISPRYWKGPGDGAFRRSRSRACAQLIR